MINILRMAHDIYEGNKARGFWSENRNKGEVIALMHSEVTECFEALVGIEPEESAKTIYPLYIEELADVGIRILDYIYGYGLLTTGRMDDVEAESLQMPDYVLDPQNVLNLIRDSVIDQLHVVNMYLSHALEDLRNERDEFYNLHNALLLVAFVCHDDGYYIKDVILSKLAHNATRDHMHGKSF